MNAEAAPVPSLTPEQTASNNRGVDQDTDLENRQVGLDDWMEQSELESRAPETNGQIFGREALQGSKKLRQQVREQALTRVSGLEMAKTEAETGVASVRRKYLAYKKNSQEEKYKRYDHKAKTAVFAFRRESFAQKARWQKRHLGNTIGLLSRHDKKFGQRDEKGDRIKGQRGVEYERRKRRHIERIRELEKQRSMLLERQIVAREQKRRRAMKRTAKSEGLSQEQRARMTHLIDQLKPLGEYRSAVRDMLRKDLQKRMDKFEKTVMESSRRWRWEQENPSTEQSEALSELDHALNHNPEQTGNSEIEEDFSELEGSVDDMMDDDPDMVE